MVQVRPTMYLREVRLRLISRTRKVIISQMCTLKPLQREGSSLPKVLHHKPNICRTLRQPAHEIRIPVLTVWHIDAHIIPVARQLLLQIAANAVKHLKLECILADALIARIANGGVNHVRIVRGDSMIGAARQQKLALPARNSHPRPSYPGMRLRAARCRRLCRCVCGPGIFNKSCASS